MATATISFDASDYGGMDFDPRRAKVYATNNAVDQTIYAAGNKQYIGSGNGTINPDGTGTIDVPIPGDGDIPGTWQTTIHFDVPDRNADKGRRTVSVGPFTITATGTLNSLVEEMPIPPAYEAPALNRIDGVTDHGDVSGALELDSDISTHWLDATGPTTITITDGPAGEATRYVTVHPISGAEDITFVEPSDATLTDGAFATFAWVRGSWVLAGAGGTPDVGGGGEAVPPTAGTLAGSAISDTGFTLTVTGASDETALHASPYSFSTDNGTTWTAYQSSAAKAITGKTASTAYQCKHRVKDAAGNVTVGTAITVTTSAPPPSWDIGDDFNAANTSNINGRTTPVGGKTWVCPWATPLTGVGAIGISGNRTTSSIESARVLPDQQDYVVSCTYDVTAGGSQVRLFARASDTNAEANSAASVQAVIRANGNVEIDRGNDYSLGVRGSGQPTTGTLALEVIGTTGRVLVNGTAVGASFSVSGVTGLYAGFGLGSASIDDFKIEYL